MGMEMVGMTGREIPRLFLFTGSDSATCMGHLDGQSM
jgi:hypothetical protein